MRQSTLAVCGISLLLSSHALAQRGTVRIDVDWPAKERTLPEECRTVGVGKFKYRDEGQKSKYEKHAAALNNAVSEHHPNRGLTRWKDQGRREGVRGLLEGPREGEARAGAEGPSPHEIRGSAHRPDPVHHERHGVGTDADRCSARGEEDLDAVLDLPLLSDRRVAPQLQQDARVVRQRRESSSSPESARRSPPSTSRTRPSCTSTCSSATPRPS